jgi:hypothetical protein
MATTKKPAAKKPAVKTAAALDHMYPFRVFISHKVSGHGEAAEAIKHELENYGPEKLKIFASPALSPGVKWQPEVLKEIETADLFILLYLVEGIDMDWCLYEAGYFEREAQKTGRKLICVNNPGRSLPGPLETRQRLEATERGAEELLKAIYKDQEKPVRPDLFDREHMKLLDQLIQFILTTLKPVKQEPLCPRLFVTLSGPESLEQLKHGAIPEEARLSGEAEALKQLGLAPEDGITVANFRERSESKYALDLYIPQMANCLRRIIEKYPDLWVIPPVRLVTGSQPKVLVPASVYKGLSNSYRFEFLIYQPEPDYDPDAESPFSLLCNFFFLASTFRKRIIEDWLEAFMNLQSLGPLANAEDVRRKLQKLKLVFGAILLEAQNRNVDCPRRIEKCFPRKEDQEKLNKILDPQKGLYITQAKQLSAGIDASDFDSIIAALRQLRNINKTLLVMSAVRLQELATDKEGDLV